MLHKKRKPSTFTSSGDFAGCKRGVSRENLLHSKSTYFCRWGSMVPSVCSIALLMGLFAIFNPTTNSSADKVYAETITSNPTDYSSISMTITNAGNELSDGDTISTNVNPGLMSYIDNNIKITTSRINKFYVAVQAASDGTSELIGTNHPEAKINPVGNNIIVDNFGDNTWGYALGDATASSSSFVYNSLPAYNAAITPQYSSAQELADGDYNLKLTFAAKINADKPSDHYTTKAMVSVAADAKEITTMQEFAEVGLCSSMKENEQRQLIDDRSASGLGQTKYWIGKLKDGKCWMTQNLDLALAAGVELSSADTDILDASGKYTVPTDLGNYKDPGMVNYKVSAASAAYASSGCGNPTTANCNSYFEAYTKSDVSGDEAAHYLIGNYYPWTIAMAGQTEGNKGSICPKGWKLPTNSEYNTLIYGIANTNATANTVRTSPYYFIPAGRYVSKNEYVARSGTYLSSSFLGDVNVSVLYFTSGDMVVFGATLSYGHSVRCVLK